MTWSKFGNVLSATPFVGVTNGSNTLGCIVLLICAFNFSSTFCLIWISGSLSGGDSSVGSGSGLDLKMVVWAMVYVSSSGSAAVLD